MSDPRDALSLIAHAALPTMGPLTSAQLDALLAPLTPAPGRAALDIGGGRADLAIALHDRLGLRVTSVDRSRIACEEGRLRIGARPIEIVERDAATHIEHARPTQLALAACLGSTHALGGLTEAIAVLTARLASAGALIVGDLVRLAAVDDEAFGDLPTPDDLARALTAHALTERAHVQVSAAQLASYERHWRDTVEHHLATHPHHPAAAWAHARNTAMRDAARRGSLDHVAYLAVMATR